MQVVAGSVDPWTPAIDSTRANRSTNGDNIDDDVTMTNPDPVADKNSPSVDPSGSTDPGLPAADRHDSVKQALSEVRHTRTKSAWVGVIVGAIVLILLLVFILQNLDNQRIHLFFWTVSLPQGISLLIAPSREP